MKLIATLIFTIAFATSVLAQTLSHKEKYDTDFMFTDGIYLSKDDFKNNSPIDKSQIISGIDPTDLTYFEQLVEQKTINLFDRLGNEIAVETSKIFGFCSDGTVYINHNGTFSRVGIIGSICHFLGTKTVTNNASNPYFGYYGRYAPIYRTTTSVEPQQYLYNFETGDLLEYNTNNLETMLMGDPAIHDEYAELSRKKKNAKLFYYMRLYNEKHPIYIPVYE